MLRFISSIAIAILSNTASAQSVPDLFRFEDLIASESDASAYHRSLSLRFINGDLNEIVWDHKRGSSPRFSYDSYKSLVGTLNRFFTLHPTIKERLAEYPSIPPFALNSDGSVTLVDDESVKNWRHIFEILIAIRNKHSANEIPALIKALNRDLSENNFAKLIGPLVAAQITDSYVLRLSRERNSMSPSDQYQILEKIVSNAIQQATQLRLPGKYINNFWNYGFLKDIRRSNIFRKGITIAPMNRFEALTKGIGPGECIRYVCYRYLQALFRDSFFLKVLSDGRESGFIAINETYDSTGAKIWMIEGIQSNRIARRLRGLIRHLQNLASDSGSLLAAPTHLKWTFNYEDVQKALNAILGASSARTKLELRFRTRADVAVFDDFVKNHAPESDRQFMSLRYGIVGRLANAIHLLGNGRAFVVPAIHDSPCADALAPDGT